VRLNTLGRKAVVRGGLVVIPIYAVLVLVIFVPPLFGVDESRELGCRPGQPAALPITDC